MAKKPEIKKSKPAKRKAKAKAAVPEIVPDRKTRVDYGEILPESFWTLEDAQRVFIIAYLRSGDLEESFLAANPQTPGVVTRTADDIIVMPLYSSAARMGWLWYNTREIRVVIESVLSELRKREAMDALEIRAELSRLARSKITDVVGWRNGSLTIKPSEELTDAAAGSIKEIKETKDGLSIKMHDRTGALDKLARIEGLYRDEGETESILLDVIRQLAKKKRESRVDAEFTEEPSAEKP